MVGPPSLHVYDIHLDELVQRKGLGRFLMQLLELIARREKMACLSIAVPLKDACTEQWLLRGPLKGFQEDLSLINDGFDPAMEVPH
jgi:GNAT superfamily N-acetyltransferase